MSSTTIDLLIQGGIVVTMDPARGILDPADIAIIGDRIVEMGPSLPLQAARVIDARGRAVLPGLVDAHMHETLTRGFCEDLPLDRWLSEVCFPLDRAYTDDVMRAAAMMNQAEMIRGGITTFLDIYRYPDACAQVTLASGLRAIFAPQIIADPAGVGESLESAEEFVAGWRGVSPRISPAFGPHAPYSCPPEVYRRVGELAERYDVPVHTHLSETRWEVRVIQERYGCSPAEYVDQQGVLNPRLSVAHGVHLTPGDIQRLHQGGVAVIYNPTSNMKLASGVAPIPEMLESGLNVGLGTDSNLSNNNLDLWEEMRVGASLQKLHLGDAGALPCQTVLEMATLGGARAFHLEDQIGSLAPGKQADIILVDLNQPHLWPILEGRWMNLVEQLVYSANAADVTHTIVAGQVLMADRKLLTLDLGDVRRAVEQATRRLFSRAGMLESSGQSSSGDRG